MIWIKKNIKSIRFFVALLFFGLLIGGFLMSYAGGSYCALSVFGVEFICPLGLLQTILATGVITWKLVAAFITTLVTIIIAGRFFCAWICPTVILGKSTANDGKQKNKRTSKTAAPLIILSISLITAFIFSFPVFCLICPIGLFFGFVFAVLYLFGSFKLSWGLLIFPLMLVLEFTLFKRWCFSFCPIGALTSLISKISLFIKPTVDKNKCLSSKGKICNVCVENCSENINLKKNSNNELKNCTKCMDCWAHCPGSAIKIKFFSKK